MSSSASLSERGISAPSRRSVVRAAAWTAPAVSIAVAAPAYANCSSNKISGTLDWDGAGVSWSRSADQLSASATYTQAGAAPLTVSISATYEGKMLVGAESGYNYNFNRPAQVGGLAMGGLAFHQANHRDSPHGQVRRDIGFYTLTFSRPVSDLSFHVTDIDAATGDFRDALELTSGFTQLSRAAGVAGSGTSTDPYKSSTSNGAIDNVTGGAGNVQVRYAAAISTLKISYWNIQDAFTTDTDQITYLSDLSFAYSPQEGCAPR